MLKKPLQLQTRVVARRRHCRRHQKKKNRDARSGLGHNTFETVPTSLTGAAASNGDTRPAPLCAVDAYSARICSQACVG